MSSRKLMLHGGQHWDSFWLQRLWLPESCLDTLECKRKHCRLMYSYWYNQQKYAHLVYSIRWLVWSCVNCVLIPRLRVEEKQRGLNTCCWDTLSLITNLLHVTCTMYIYMEEHHQWILNTMVQGYWDCLALSCSIAYKDAPWWTFACTASPTTWPQLFKRAGADTNRGWIIFDVRVLFKEIR